MLRALQWFKKVTDYALRYRSPVPVVQTMDSAIHPINFDPADNTIIFGNTYPLDSSLSGGYCYPTFEKRRPRVQTSRLPHLSFPAPAPFLLASSHLRNIKHRCVITSAFYPFQNFHLLPFPRPRLQ